MKPAAHSLDPENRSPGVSLWALGIAASACAHLGVLAALIPFLAPDPVVQQPSPESALTMESQQVARSRAQEQRANPERGKQISAQGDSLGAGAVQETSARPSSPALLPVTATPSQGDQIASRAPQGVTTSSQIPKPQPAVARVASGEPVPVRLAPSQPVSARPALAEPVPTRPVEAQPLSERPAAAQTLQAQRPELPAALVQAPASNVVTAAAQNPTDASATSPQALAHVTQTSIAPTQPLAEAATAPQYTPESQPQAEAITAALAFQGDATKDLDPASIAAFQSFTRPGDPTSQAAGLRDGVAGLLAAVPCSRLQVVFDPETATLELRGHLPEDALRQPILAALQGQMGRDIALSDKMRLLPRPQCGALSGISSVGLPQSTDQITNPLLLGPDAQARVLGYSGGEQLYFDLTAPDYPAYLYVDYFDAAGDVIHLSPNAHIPLKLAAPKSPLRVGAKTPEDPGLRITVGPPYGQEIAVAFAASTPLYEGLRPLSEPAAPYLDFLRRKVAEKRSEDADFKGEWVYFLVETQAN